MNNNDTSTSETNSSFSNEQPVDILKELEKFFAIRFATSFEDLLRRGIELILQILPYEGAALVFYDNDCEELQGYVGGGIFKKEKIPIEFTFTANHLLSKSSQPPYPIQEAFYALSNPNKYNNDNKMRELNQEIKPLLISRKKSCFFLSNINKLAQDNKISVNPVYKPGKNLHDFTAIPMLYFDPSKKKIFGLIVLNNLKKNLIDVESLKQLYDNTILPMGWQIAQLLSIIICNYRLNHINEKSNIILKKIRASFSDMKYDQYETVSDVVEQCFMPISNILYEEMDADFTVSLRISEDKPEQYHLIWQNSPNSFEIIKKSYSKLEKGEWITHTKDIFGGSRSILMNANDSINGNGFSFLIIQSWHDPARKESIVTYLMKNQAINKKIRFSNKYLSEDREIINHVVTEIQNGMNIIIKSQESYALRINHLIEFVVDSAHKIQSPVALIKDDLITLESDFSRRTFRDIYPGIQKALNKLFHIIRMHGKIMGADTIEKKSVDPLEIIETARENVFGNKSEKIEIKKKGDIPYIVVDGNKVTTAIEELIYNAKKYGDANRMILLTIRHDKKSEFIKTSNKNCLIIEVRNEGAIPTELLKHRRLFEPFVASTSKGTGLGLAYVKKVMDAHSGKIELESNSINGTIFRLYFPYGKTT